MPKLGITEANYRNAASVLGCEVAAIKAVAEVESRGEGFLPDGRPTILFERHWFHKLTNGRWSDKHPTISARKAGGYGPAGEYQHDRLALAASLNRNAALKSASWGRFQIMGFNFDDAGYPSVQAFINAMYAAEANHLMAFVNFVKSNNLADELRRLDWKEFARVYNGKNYKINKYDTKMAAAYRRYRKHEEAAA